MLANGIHGLSMFRHYKIYKILCLPVTHTKARSLQNQHVPQQTVLRPVQRRQKHGGQSDLPSYDRALSE